MNAFIGKLEMPADDDLLDVLGRSAQKLWDGLLIGLAERGVTQREWHSYSPKAGWALRLKRGARAIVYLSPRPGFFLASFALGDKAVAAARSSELPARVIRIIDDAKRYVEGTAVRIEVKSPADVPVVLKLAEIKLAH